jgi:4a-hydroxytetrahydrobiopterin dehydratase
MRHRLVQLAGRIARVDLLDMASVDVAIGQGSGWHREDNQLVKAWSGRDFAEALAYVNAVGALAERAGHHPDIMVHWNRVTLRLWTHSVGGLTQADLDLAAEIDCIVEDG